MSINRSHGELFGYWRFLAERHRVWQKRYAGESGPWTQDKILQEYRFTCTFRILDRTSQFLLREVQYNRDWSPRDVIVRTFLFKMFNLPATWQHLVTDLGDDAITFDNYDPGAITASIKGAPEPRRSSAYRHGLTTYRSGIPEFEKMAWWVADAIRDGTVDKLLQTNSLREAFDVLNPLPDCGGTGFIANQHCVDIAYSPAVAWQETGYVPAGPGCYDCLSKIVGRMISGTVSDGKESVEAKRATKLLLTLTEHQDEALAQVDEEPIRLFGRPLHPVDIQSGFCEFGKYLRLKNPDPASNTRSQYKRTFLTQIAPKLEKLVLPKKWSIS